MSEADATIEPGLPAVQVAATALALQGKPPDKCKNCLAPLVGAYCAICGQEQDAHRRTVKGLVHEVVTDVVNFDSRMLRTAHALLLEPGELACAFREGRTRPYVPPVRLYLFVSLVFFVILSFANIGLLQFAVEITGQANFTRAADKNFVVKVDPKTKLDPATVERMKKVGIDLQPGKYDANSVPIISGKAIFFAPIGSVQSRLPPQTMQLIGNLRKAVNETTSGTVLAPSDKVLQGVEHIARDPAAINGPLTVWVPRVLVLLVPLFAGVLMLFYFRARKHYYYVDHLVFALDYFSAAFVILLIAAGAVQILPGALVAWLTIGALGIYLILAMKRFYGQNWWRTGLKFAGAMSIYLIFILAPAVMLVMVASISEA